MKNFAVPSVWQSEILKRATHRIDIFKFVVGIIIVIFLFFVAFLNSPLSQFLVVRKEVLSLIAICLGITFSLILPPVRNWYTPKRVYYRSAAVAIVEELQQQEVITHENAEKLKDDALRLLGPLEDKNCKTNLKELLSQACDEMARVVKGEA